MKRKISPPLLSAAARTAPVAARSTFPYHVTCGAIAVDAAGRVLQIRHKELERWLLPGGHLENEDESLVDAALRELREETGITGNLFPNEPFAPIDIDPHPIPENAAKGEPAHVHFDCRFMIEVRPGSVTLQTTEVDGHRWQPAQSLSGRVGARVRAALVARERSK